MAKYASQIARLSAVAVAAALAVAASATGAGAQQLKHYNSAGKDFWMHPPPDWFLGDKSAGQRGLAPPSGPATPTPLAELNENLKHITLPPGFSIKVYASGLPEARQMA